MKKYTGTEDANRWGLLDGALSQQMSHEVTYKGTVVPDTWSIDYSVGDAGFLDEWWHITNREKSYRCDSEEDAQWLCDQLNRLNQE
jgi:hypothetical protein